MKDYMKNVFKPVAAERVEVVADLMIKLAGETIQSKLARAVLIGAITAATQYVKDGPAAPIPSAPVVPSQAQSTK